MSSRRVSSQHITRAIVLALASASISNAAVTLTGDTNPTNPASINSSTNLIVGQNSLGTMTVNGGSSISTANGFLGYDVGADGQVTLNGSSSSWINSNALMVARQEGSSGTLSVSHGALVSTSGLLLDAGLFSTAIATFDGEGTLLASNEVRLGQSGDGTLKFLNGAQGTTLNLVTAGLTFGSHYDIQITGANSKWTTGQVRLSDNGSGSLLISNGGVMDSIKAELISQQQPSSTNIKIDGAGSLWKINGAFKTLVGETTIEVLNGGSLVTGNTQLAVEIENPTNVRLNGPGSSWAANGSIYNQNGTMRIENIANVSCNYFDVSSTDTVQSTVITGAGSSLEVLTQLWVGRTKHTELRVENGGQLATVNTNVGGDSGYNGLITITGANSNWFAFGSTGIGDRLGASALTIANGGRFDAHGNITLAEFTNGAGTINLNGGTLNAHGRYIIFGLGTGTVNFNSGRLEHVSQYTSNLVQNGGALQLGPDDGTGEMHMEGAYQLTAAGTLELDLAGPTLENFDLLRVDQPSTLAGALKLGILGSYNPAYLHAHEVITVPQINGIDGIFKSIDGVAFQSNKYLAVTYDANSVFVTAALPADTNLDGHVDFADLLTVAQNYGQNGMTWADGEFSGNGNIGFEDLLLAAQNYGDHLVLGDVWNDSEMHARFDADWQTALMSVPEPGALSMLVLAGIVLKRRTR